MAEIPQSSALLEASDAGDSLAEVMSRDPEGLSWQDRDRIIEALRAQRARIAAAEAAGPKPKAPRAPAVPLSEKSGKDLSEMDL